MSSRTEDEHEIVTVHTADDEEIIESPITQRQYVVTPYRWVLLSCFSLALAGSGFCMVGFSAVATVLVSIYDTSDFMLSFCVLIYLILYVPANFVVMFLLNKYGVRVTLICGALLSLIGAWLRMLIVAIPNFGVVLGGSAFVAFAQAFF